MKANKHFWALLLFLPLSMMLLAQNREYTLRLVYAEVGDPVSFATVRFKGTSQGLIADYNGEFRLPESIGKNNPVLVVSSIGYQIKEIKLLNLELGTLNTIPMIPQIEALDLVIIQGNSKQEAKRLIKRKRTLTAEQLVGRAINHIPKNLSIEPHSYIGYYREYQLVEDRYHNLNEFIIETFDKGIQSDFLSTKNTAVYSIYKNPFYVRDYALLTEYDGERKFITGAEMDGRGGNEYKILHTHNPVRSYNVNTFSFVYNLEKDFIIQHDFRREGITYINNEPLAIVSFNKAKKYPDLAYGIQRGEAASRRINPIKGTILISLKDYAIHQFNYQYKQFDREIFHVNIEYARYEDEKM
jgi:hypothetical protein